LVFHATIHDRYGVGQQPVDLPRGDPVGLGTLQQGHALDDLRMSEDGVDAISPAGRIVDATF
jgi:hypothetical protein